MLKITCREIPLSYQEKVFPPFIQALGSLTSLSISELERKIFLLFPYGYPMRIWVERLYKESLEECEEGYSEGYDRGYDDGLEDCGK
jgi:hypothetical protein